MSTQTNEFGAYWFMDLPAGPFHVWEENRPGWVQTRPADPAGYSGELAVGDIVRGLVFGNHLEAAEIHGRKYNDLDNSGGWDEGEPFLEGWEIALDLGNDGTADMITTTNEFGAYWFMDLPSGPFALWEVVQDGWVLTEPASGMYTGDLNAGDILRGMLFGNHLENLVANGSFEEGTDPGAASIVVAGAADITSWSVDAGSVDYIGSH